MVTKYSITKDHTTTKLSLSRTSSTEVIITKQNGYTRAFFSKDGNGIKVRVINHGDGSTSGVVADNIFDPSNQQDITDPSTGLYITDI